MRLGTNLMSRTGGKGWENAPVGQLQRYLGNAALADKGTWGIVTTGTQWVLQRRQNPYESTVCVENPATLAEINELLEEVGPSEDRDSTAPPWEDWLAEIAKCPTPADFLRG